jgi:glyceraldehyde 3-phosphate dehydrogenase
MKVFSTYDPTELDWQGVDVVLECTGKFNEREGRRPPDARRAPRARLRAGEERRQDRRLRREPPPASPEHLVVSNGSCTTNCLAPLAKVLHEAIGIERGHHDDDPQLHRRPADARPPPQGPLPRARRGDGDDPDLDRRRQGAQGGAAGARRAPRRHRDPRADAQRLLRRPDLRGEEGRDRGRRERGVREAAAGARWAAVLAYDPEPKVSIDFNHTTHSSIFAPDQTKVVGKRTVRVLAWYDNEWGFSARMADVSAAMGRLLH